jgi:hypothetical protein
MYRPSDCIALKSLGSSAVVVPDQTLGPPESVNRIGPLTPGAPT